MTYNALDIAQYIITRCMNLKHPVSNLKLQKLLYFVQGSSLAKLGDPAFGDSIYAWKFGPVVPVVYYEYSSYAGTPIMRRYDLPTIKSDLLALVNNEIDNKLDVPAWQLVNETHETGSPWDNVFNVLGIQENGIISTSAIQKYFVEKVH